MAATTISDLPRDALVLILRAVFDAAALEGPFGNPPKMHQQLRRVSREWRDAADFAYIEHKNYCIELNLNGWPVSASARLRYPSMAHSLTIFCRYVLGACTVPITALALSSLYASAELRRVLKRVSLTRMSCSHQVAAAVSAIVACPNLTYVQFEWVEHEHDHGILRDMLNPLTALTGLKELSMDMESDPDALYPWLPGNSTLSSIELGGEAASFVVMGSDASLERLRRLSLRNSVTLGYHHWWSSDDPFRLRAGLDTGAWRPHLLTRLQSLSIMMISGPPDADWENLEFDGATPAAAVWAPLAPTVTELELICEFSVHRVSDLETGMYAGLGVLTGLRNLIVTTEDEWLSPVDFGRVRLPHLTFLSVRNYVGPPIDLARFPRLVHAEIESKQPEPLALSSVAALRRLASLRVSGWPRSWHSSFRRPPREQEPKPRLNLAQLFGGGRGLAALTALSFERVTLAWDEAAAAGAPPASEFAAGAATLLPSLRSVEIKQDVEMDEGVREFVVPAVRALGRG